MRIKLANLSDAALMLVVLDACIAAQTLPALNSPCHKRIKKIIKDENIRNRLQERNLAKSKERKKRPSRSR